MTSDELKKKIKQRFGETPEVIQLNRKEWLMDSQTGQTWKSHLQRIFKIRQKGDGITVELSQEIGSFLRHLDKMNKNSSLYSFTATTKENHYGGWLIDNEVAFCVPTKIIKQNTEQ